MYAVMGITGRVGGAVARTLLAAGMPVRAVVRDAGRGRAWAKRGCEVTVAEMDDAASLARAFAGTRGAFVAGFSRILGRPVRVQAMPREGWEAAFRSAGSADPTLQMQMLDGFNEGWIAFERGDAERLKGRVELETVLGSLVG